MIELPQYLIDRFWSKVDKTSGPDGHWLWTSTLFKETDYGMFSFSIDGKIYKYLAHRVAYELTEGPIPEGMYILHKPPCNVRRCVRHIYAGTQKENLADAIAMDTIARGERNWQVAHPEKLKRGLDHPSTVVTQEMVDAIQSLGSSMSRKAMAVKFGISVTTVSQIQLCQYQRNDLIYKLPPNNRFHGENHHRAKLTQENVDEMRALYATGQWSQYELGHYFGVARTTVAGIVRGEERKH